MCYSVDLQGQARDVQGPHNSKLTCVTHSRDVAHLATFRCTFRCHLFLRFSGRAGVTSVMARRVTDCTYYLTSGCHKVR